MRILHPIFVLLAALFLTASGFLFDKSRESDRVLANFVTDSTRGVPASDTDQVAMAISREVFRRTDRYVPNSELSLFDRLEAASIFNVSASVSIQHGIFGVVGHPQLGPCGTMSRVMIRSLEQVHVASRKLQLLDDVNGQGGGHTMIEYRSNGRWVVLSPSDSSFVWRDHEGRLATVDEIRGDSTIFAQIFTRFPNYPYRFNNTSHIRWAKLPPAGRAVFHWLLGEKGYRDALTPYLYDRPRLLLFYCAFAAFVLFTVLALLTRTPSPRVVPSRRAVAA